MFLYANGCSMTFGSELMGDDDNLTVVSELLNQKRLRQAWPGRLAEKLGCEGHHNDAVGGCTNEMIVRNLLVWITQEWLEKGKDPKELFVVLNWTQITRWEFFFDDVYDTLFSGHDPFDNRPKDFKRFWARFEDYGCGDPWLGWRKFVVQVVQVQAFLENQGIQYAMGFGVVSPARMVMKWLKEYNSPTLMVEYFKFAELVNKRRFMGFYGKDSGMCQFLYQNGWTDDDLAPRGHPRADGHEAWSEYLKLWIRSERLMEPD